MSAISWDKFHRAIRIELIKSPDERIDVTYFMKTCRDEYDRLMETCPPIDKDVIEEFKTQLTTGDDPNEIARKIENFNKLIKPDIFNELITLKDVVHKPCEIKIDMANNERISRAEQEKKTRMTQTSMVSNFMTSFAEKYSRQPSTDEILSNLSALNALDLRVVLDEMHVDYENS